MGYRAAYHFEHGADHPGLTNSSGNPPTTDEVTATGAIGGGYSKHYVFAANDSVVYNLLGSFTRDAVGDAMCVAAAIKSDIPAPDHDNMQLVAHSESTGTDTSVGVVVKPNGAIEVRRYSSPGTSLESSGTLLASAPAGTFTFGVRQFLSLRVVMDNTVGEVQVEVNGVEVINETGIDTVHSSSLVTDWGPYVFFDADSGDLWFDDFVVADGLAAPIPPITHEALVPDGVTADNDGTPTGAATNWEAVDEIPQDGGTTYVTMPVGKQGFTFTNRTETGTPVYVQHMASIGDPSLGSEVVNGFVSDGTEVDGSQISLDADFTGKPISDLLEAPPSGGSWDTATVNSLTAGLERAS